MMAGSFQTYNSISPGGSVMWRAMLGLVWGILLVLVGSALAINYRGVATRHIELAMRFVRPVSPSNRMSWSDERIVRRRARFIVLDRILGVMIILAGSGSLVIGGIF